MTLFAPVEAIRVSVKRQRKTFSPDTLAELGASISKIGLLHAPVLRAAADGTGFELVAGERRFRAITDLHELGVIFRYGGEEVPHGQVPYVTLGQLDPLDAWEAELEENIQREDLTWQERAAATAELMELRKAQADERGSAPPTVASIARELRPDEVEPTQSVRQELIVSRFLKDPEVAAAKTVNEAVKILKKREEKTKQAELAAVIGKTFSSASHTLLNEDFIAWSRSAPPAQFDIILTDPPYGMGADEFGDSGQGTAAAAHGYEDSYENWLTLMRVFPSATFALAKADAHAYVFCDLDRFPELRTRMSEAGWRVHRTPLIWHNTDGFRVPWVGVGPQRKYECILFAVKGEKKANSVKPDVLAYGKDAALGHPAQKPVALLLDLLTRSAKPGDRVLDPCAGSGATIEACHELKLSCTALEQLPWAYGIAAKRMQDLKALEETLL
ncbi:MAG: DNA modification methylase [Actinomycetia bacterium]|nr:DNA modification methylase [Actinomycetes bacterium]